MPAGAGDWARRSSPANPDWPNFQTWHWKRDSIPSPARAARRCWRTLSIATSNTVESKVRPVSGPDWHTISSMKGEGEWETGASGIADALRQLFEGLPDIYLFAKDLQGRFTFSNQIFVEKCGLKKAEDLLGLTDFEVFPRHLAEKYVRDDAQ